MVCGGCVSIKRDVKLVDYPEGARHVDRVVGGSRQYHASAEIADDNLIIKLSKLEICEEADVPIVRRKRLITKTEVPSLFGIQAEWLAAAGGVVFGGGMLARPETACSSTSQDGTATTTDPQSCVALGWALVGVGALVTTIAIVDSIRVADEEQDLGTHDGEYTASRRDCHAGPVARTAVELRLGERDARLSGTTTPLGEAAFSMVDVDERELPSPSTPASVVIAGEAVPVPITEQQHHILSSNLLGNPHSRIARSASEIAQKNCDKAVGDAGRVQIKPDTGDAIVADSQDVWRRARAGCAEHWTADHQAKSDIAGSAILDNRIGAVLVALNAGDLDRVEDLLEHSPDVVTRLRQDPDVLPPLRRAVGEPTRALMLTKRNDTEIQHRLCRARQTFVRIRGSSDWDQFKVEVARNVSELGGGTPSTIVRLMDATRCE
jgi:hypothetical protein